MYTCTWTHIVSLTVSQNKQLIVRGLIFSIISDNVYYGTFLTWEMTHTYDNCYTVITMHAFNKIVYICIFKVENYREQLRKEAELRLFADQTASRTKLGKKQSVAIADIFV